jgi:hypothetical protein
MTQKIRHDPPTDLPPKDPQSSDSGLENLISPQDPSTMSRAEDDAVVFEHSPEFHDREGQGVEPPRPRDKRRPDDPALEEGPGPAEGRTDNRAGG